MKGRGGTFLTVGHTPILRTAGWTFIFMQGTKSYGVWDPSDNNDDSSAVVCRNFGSLLPCSSPRVMRHLFTSSPLSPVSPKTSSFSILLLTPLGLHKRSALAPYNDIQLLDIYNFIALFWFAMSLFDCFLFACTLQSLCCLVASSQVKLWHTAPPSSFLPHFPNHILSPLLQPPKFSPQISANVLFTHPLFS